MAKKILLIDDDAGTRLRKHGFETVFAADSVQAIAVAYQTRSDAIVLDLGLPGGNGIDRTAPVLSSHGQLAGISVLQVTAG
jgi:DNA-binding response OmpR family regulator